MDLGKRIPRRSLLAKSAAGLAAAGAVAAVPAFVFKPDASGESGAVASADGANSFDTPIVAYVHDASKGEVAVMFGTNEVVINDPKLVARLLGATRG